MLGMVVGTFFSCLFAMFDPRIADKAGPDWLWAGGRRDPVRSLYFRPDGRFRRYGRLGLLCTLFGGSAALYWML